MKRRLYLAFVILLSGCALSFGLTPKEREIVLHAKGQLEAAQKEQQHSKDLADWAMQSNQEAWDFAAATKAAADKTGIEIDIAHQHEKDQAAYIGKMEPVYKAVTRWWDLGAFVWGVKQLLKHLLILAFVGAALAAVVYGLSFLFPIIGLGLGIARGLIVKVIRVIVNRFKRK
jgi:hypothetical protein